jgi:hypothetical protein
MYGKQQSSDQFRAFFPASRAVNAPVTLDRVAREQAQRPPYSYTQSQDRSHSYSYTQSQDRSQATTSQHESQLSPPRYDELLASGRHLEIKDTLAALGRTVSTLSQSVGAMQTTMSAQESKLGGIQESLRQMNEAQARQEQSMAQLLKVVEELREERLSHASSSSFEASGPEDCAEPVSPLSEAGISVSEYLKVKRLRIKESPPKGATEVSMVFPNRVTDNCRTTLCCLGEGRKRSRSNVSSQATTDSLPATPPVPTHVPQVQAHSIPPPAIVVSSVGMLAAGRSIGARHASEGMLFDEF